MKRSIAMRTAQGKRATARASAAKARSPKLSGPGKRIVSALKEVADDVSGRKTLPRRGGTVPKQVDVQAIREKLGMSQVEFAEAYGFSIATLRNWEQHRREPDGAAKVLLAVIERAPEAVRQALADSNTSEGE
jgi:putative transcriptional regulator